MNRSECGKLRASIARRPQKVSAILIMVAEGVDSGSGQWTVDQ